jgi:hypothetical protein
VYKNWLSAQFSDKAGNIFVFKDMISYAYFHFNATTNKSAQTFVFNLNF